MSPLSKTIFSPLSEFYSQKFMVNRCPSHTLDWGHTFGRRHMTHQQNAFRIDYYDSKGGLMFSGAMITPMDHWDLCAHVWGNLPEGAEDFNVSELPVMPLGAEVAAVALCA